MSIREQLAEDHKSKTLALIDALSKSSALREFTQEIIDYLERLDYELIRKEHDQHAFTGASKGLQAAIQGLEKLKTRALSPKDKHKE